MLSAHGLLASRAGPYKVRFDLLHKHFACMDIENTILLHREILHRKRLALSTSDEQRPPKWENVSRDGNLDLDCEYLIGLNMFEGGFRPFFVIAWRLSRRGMSRASQPRLGDCH
jgi:hypothetical protein